MTDINRLNDNNKQHRGNNSDLSSKISRFTRFLIFGGSDRRWISRKDHKKVEQEITTTKGLLSTALKPWKQSKSEVQAKGAKKDELTKEIEKVLQSSYQARKQANKRVTSKEVEQWQKDRQRLSELVEILGTDSQQLQQDTNKAKFEDFRNLAQDMEKSHDDLGKSWDMLYQIHDTLKAEYILNIFQTINDKLANLQKELINIYNNDNKIIHDSNLLENLNNHNTKLGEFQKLIDKMVSATNSLSDIGYQELVKKTLPHINNWWNTNIKADQDWKLVVRYSEQEYSPSKELIWRKEDIRKAFDPLTPKRIFENDYQFGTKHNSSKPPPLDDVYHFDTPGLNFMPLPSSIELGGPKITKEYKPAPDDFEETAKETFLFTLKRIFDSENYLKNYWQLFDERKDSSEPKMIIRYVQDLKQMTEKLQGKFDKVYIDGTTSLAISENKLESLASQSTALGDFRDTIDDLINILKQPGTASEVQPTQVVRNQMAILEQKWWDIKNGSSDWRHLLDDPQLKMVLDET